jgi:integrase
MAILAECPICHRKQSIHNKVCAGCGDKIDKQKRNGNVRFWIAYQLDGKQRKEFVGMSIEQARDAEGKRRGQKREGVIFADSKLTYAELTEWYTGLEGTKFNIKRNRPKSDYRGVVGRIGKWNEVFGSRRVDSITHVDIESYQLQRQREGLAPASIDQQLTNVKTMVKKAFNTDMSNGKALKAFNNWQRLLVRGSNARSRTVSFTEYTLLLRHAPAHLWAILVVLMNTGMRVSEARQLRWSYVDRKAGMLRLPKEAVKEDAPRIIPINSHVESVLNQQTRALHHDYIFSYRGKPIGKLKGAWRSFRETCVKAKIPYGREVEGGLTAHDFRRTVKTNMLAAGVAKEYRDKILGHSMKGMDVHYLKPSEDDLEAAMDRYTDWMDEQMTASLAQNLAQVKTPNP